MNIKKASSAPFVRLEFLFPAQYILERPAGMISLALWNPYEPDSIAPRTKPQSTRSIVPC